MRLLVAFAVMSILSIFPAFADISPSSIAKTSFATESVLASKSLLLDISPVGERRLGRGWSARSYSSFK